MDMEKEALLFHEKSKGKIGIYSKVPINDKEGLSLAYSPGVAEPCKEIAKDKEKAYNYTSKGNLVAVVSDGTAVLGLGNIGPEAALPVMEGKSILFKKFADIDGFPICLNTTDVDEIVKTVKYLAPTFGGINLEDIAAPRCFDIEQRLKAELDIPVFHDDQHGTAIVVLAGLLNALKLTKKRVEDVKVVVNGAGSAGIAITKLLLKAGVKDITLVNIEGIVYKGAPFNNKYMEEISARTNPRNLKGTVADALKGSDVFIGVSAPNIISKEMIQSMNKDSIVFALANPIPEIMPEEALKGGAKVVGSGRSDMPNQVNNLLAFPGIFKGALAVRAKEINEEMKVAAARAIAEIIQEHELSSEYIIPDPFDMRVPKAVAEMVAQAAIKSGVARI